MPGHSDFLFNVVEIEVNSRCNRSCSYCPVSLLPITRNRLMSPEVFARLIDNLDQCAFKGRISYHRYSEPLLRKDLELLVRLVTRRLPNATQVLYTNGDLLSDGRYRTLSQAGIRQFVVTRHDGTEIQRRSRQVILYPSDLILTNRGGMLGVTAEPLTTPCFAPSEMLIVALNGDVLLCYEDSRAENVMGNILRQPLAEIWFSARFVELRAFLRNGRRSEAGALCSNCDNAVHARTGLSSFMVTRRGTF